MASKGITPMVKPVSPKAPTTTKKGGFKGGK